MVDRIDKSLLFDGWLGENDIYVYKEGHFNPTYNGHTIEIVGNGMHLTIDVTKRDLENLYLRMKEHFEPKE